MTTKIGNYCFHPKEAIGKGATGIVYKGISLTNHTPVAIKAVNLANLRDEPSRSLL